MSPGLLAGNAVHRNLAFVVAVAIALLAGMLFGGNSADAKGKHKRHKTRVSILVVTKNQADLLKTKKVKVKIRVNRKTSVVALLKGRAAANFVPVSRKKKVRFKRKGVRKVSLRLKSSGIKRLGTCGNQKVRAEVKYRRGKKKAKAKAGRKLARQESLCETVEPPVLPNPETKANCDPVDPAACLAPFPNDYFTKPDSSTDTNLRLDFKSANLPVNTDGKSSFDPAFNRNDGFSPNSVIVTRIPGFDTPATFRENELVPQMNIGAYDKPDQRVVLIDTTTNQRVPIWSELDMVPGTPNPHANGLVQGTAKDRAILIHPAQSLEYGRRYVVALRGLTSGGAALPVNDVFKYLRDDVKTANPQVETRRTQMKPVFATTDAAGIDRSSLNVAWDFTVASERNLTERVLSMGQDAFEQLGDNNLADGKIEGTPPAINDVVETPYNQCPADVTMKCGNGQSRYAFKKITGTITVPCYMNAPGAAYTFGNATTPCASGSRLNYAPNSDLPEQKTDGNGDPVTWEAPFTCIVPRTSKNATTQQTSGLKAIVFGHGLMQDNHTTEQLGFYPAALEGVACGTDWIGLSSSDLQAHLLKMINILFGGSDLSLFPALPDRTQQGYINTLYLARALAHEDGFASLPEFQDNGGNPIFSINQNDTGDDLGYYGVSLGGINGGATTALAPDWERATLAVPGMGFSTLLTRSTQFNQFLPTVYAAYTNPIERSIGIAMLQTLWDRGEPSAYSKSILNGGLGTPPHKVLIQESFGDHQVANTQTQTLARTLGATAKGPILTPGRILDVGTNADPGGKYLFTPTADVDPYWNIPVAPSSQFNQAGGLPGENAVMMTTDTGPVRHNEDGNAVLGTKANPDWNIAPVSGNGTVDNAGYDPHQPGATSPATQQMLMPFLTGQGYFDPCGDGAPDIDGQPPFATPLTSPNPVPCPAPAIDYIGNGK
ncbi:MAG: hypothetical protein IPK93_04515 [Solirubrobacterales bacterium]|nr:hypothetical protein [Solirubrobacterales bacterium]